VTQRTEDENETDDITSSDEEEEEEIVVAVIEDESSSDESDDVTGMQQISVRRSIRSGRTSFMTRRFFGDSD
jgi:hypothetical protein